MYIITFGFYLPFNELRLFTCEYCTVIINFTLIFITLLLFEYSIYLYYILLCYFGWICHDLGVLNTRILISRPTIDTETVTVPSSFCWCFTSLTDPIHAAVLTSVLVCVPHASRRPCCLPDQSGQLRCESMYISMSSSCGYTYCYCLLYQSLFVKYNDTTVHWE